MPSTAIEERAFNRVVMHLIVGKAPSGSLRFALQVPVCSSIQRTCFTSTSQPAHRDFSRTSLIVSECSQDNITTRHDDSSSEVRSPSSAGFRSSTRSQRSRAVSIRPTQASSTSTQRLLMVGDSLTVGSLPYQAGAFIDNGWTDIAINAYGSRGVKTKVSADPHTGLTAVDALPRRSRRRRPVGRRTWHE